MNFIQKAYRNLEEIYIVSKDIKTKRKKQKILISVILKNIIALIEVVIFVMLAYLINPKNKKISAAKYSGDHQDIYTFLNDARAFDVVRLYENQDVAFVDDEGLYVEDQYFWIHKR